MLLIEADIHARGHLHIDFSQAWCNMKADGLECGLIFVTLRK